MRSDPWPGPWQELENAGWLLHTPAETETQRQAIAAQLLDATVLTQVPGRNSRAHAADAALRLTCCPALREMPPLDQLTGLALATHLSPGALDGVIEAERLGRVCALAPDGLPAALDRLVDMQVARR
ncbi:hypothetical protein ACH4VR_13345 [Streptomyces sp. NPDC020883]|uniref:hypothetical protein n=1 Tax=Streptomyces sp. NPDC020883 TaxID=3365099 RepID=UPI0037AE2A4D